MDAKNVNISKFLTGNQQLKTPIFQKQYDWTKEDCEILFNDLLKVGLDDNVSSHFIGTLLLSKEENSNIVEEFQIIDGQQRITTLSLLVIALASYFKNNIIEYYLINPLETGYKKYKLILNGNDEETFIKIINSIESDLNAGFNGSDSENIINNFLFFKNKLNVDNFKIVYEGFRKLTAVNIVLNETDNPQLVYDALNENNSKLNINELIRNYIFFEFSSKKQEELYEKYWIYLDKEFNESPKFFNEFIRYYLTIKLKRVSDMEHVYNDFKTYSDSYSNKEELIEDLFKYAREFFNFKVEKMDFVEIDTDDLEEQLKNLNYREDPYKFFKNNSPAKVFFDELYGYVIDLDDSMHLKFLKRYMSFRRGKKAIVDMYPRSTELVLTFNVPFNKFYDPKSKCRDLTNMGHWGIGDVEFRIKNIKDLDYARYLIKQSYNYNKK